MPVAFVRSNLLVLSIHEQLLEGLGSGRGAVQWQEANGGSRGGLVSQRLGNLEVIEGWRADRPRVAEKLLLITVDDGKVGRVWLGG